MKSMKALHEDFMRNASIDLPGVHRFPVQPKEPQPLLIPQNRWEIIRDSTGMSYMSKTYQFMSMQDRNAFVRDILIYEEEFEHCSSMTISEKVVAIVVTTKSVGVTEVDKDYARYADETFKDVTFNV